jgi:hypothetical protein
VAQDAWSVTQAVGVVFAAAGHARMWDKEGNVVRRFPRSTAGITSFTAPASGELLS